MPVGDGRRWEGKARKAGGRRVADPVINDLINILPDSWCAGERGERGWGD